MSDDHLTKQEVAPFLGALRRISAVLVETAAEQREAAQRLEAQLGKLEKAINRVADKLEEPCK